MFVWLFSWEGLHPPLSGVLHGLIQALGGGLHIHWTATVLAGFGGATALALSGWRASNSLAALGMIGLFSISPLQLNYALNASPYPWTLLLLGLSSAAVLRVLEPEVSPKAWTTAAALSALAAQVHVLALAAVGVQTMFLAARYGLKPASWPAGLRKWAVFVGVSTLFLVAVSLYKTTDPWTFHIGDEEPWPRTARHVLESRFGDLRSYAPVVLLMLSGSVVGLLTPQRRAVGLLVSQAFAMLLALAFFMEQQVADPRLTHYYAPIQLLLLAAGTLGVAAGAERLGRPGFVLGLLLLLGAGGVAWKGTINWHAPRVAAAEHATSIDDVKTVARLWQSASHGDVVAYLWDHRFLNDEPEHFDPIAALWPTSRMGRPCFQVEAPRMQCNQHGGARFYFDPKANSDEFDSLEETLRLVINSAEAPGRARLVIVPGEDAPERPWPVDPWFEAQGGVLEDHPQAGAQVWTFPVGLRIPAPPPLHP